MSLLENPTVLVAIVAAASTLAGVFVAQLVALFAAWVQHRRQHKILLRDKYEQVAVLFAQSIQWFQTVQASESIKELQLHAYPNHARQMYSLCLVYFPKLLDPAADYMNSLVMLQHCLLNNFDSSVPATAGAQAHRHSTDEYLEVTNKAIAVRNNFENAIEKHAQTYAAL